jgi:hypothetical protein
MNRSQGGGTTGSKSSNPMRPRHFIAIAAFGSRLWALRATGKSRNVGMPLINRMWDSALPA